MIIYGGFTLAGVDKMSGKEIRIRVHKIIEIINTEKDFPYDKFSEILDLLYEMVEIHRELEFSYCYGNNQVK